MLPISNLILLALISPHVVVFVDFAVLHLWSGGCALVLGAAAWRAPRGERLTAITAFGVSFAITLLLPLAFSAHAANVVGLALGLVPAVAVAGCLVQKNILPALRGLFSYTGGQPSRL